MVDTRSNRSRRLISGTQRRVVQNLLRFRDPKIILVIIISVGKLQLKYQLTWRVLRGFRPKQIQIVNKRVDMNKCYLSQFREPCQHSTCLHVISHHITSHDIVSKRKKRKVSQHVSSSPLWKLNKWPHEKKFPWGQHWESNINRPLEADILPLNHPSRRYIFWLWYYDLYVR